jgi:hypothetical protein
MPPNQFVLQNDQHMEFDPGTYLSCVFYRRHWWQFWRPKRLWLVLRRSPYAFKYGVELYYKHNPAHKKLMAELGRPGFEAINFRGVPVTPDSDTPEQPISQMVAIGEYINKQPRRTGELTPVPKIKTDKDGYGWGANPNNPAVLKGEDDAPI